MFLCRIGDRLVINNNSNHRATSTISYLYCKSISYKKNQENLVLVIFWEELTIYQICYTMKSYEYTKYSQTTCRNLYFGFYKQ